MKSLLFIVALLSMSSAARADLTHRITSSVQLTVDAAATNVQRIGNSLSVSGNGVTTSDGTTAGVVGGLGTVGSNGVAAPPSITATQQTAGSAFSFSSSYTAGDAIVTTAPAVGAVNSYSNQTSTAIGVAGDLAGTITSAGVIGLTAGGGGTSATGQVVTEITVR
jgi:hypothetical protein